MTQMADRLHPPNTVMIIELACYNNLLKIVLKSAVFFCFFSIRSVLLPAYILHNFFIHLTKEWKIRKNEERKK